MYNIRLGRDFFETCNKWLKWEDVPVDIKISSPRGCHPCPGVIYMYKIMKTMYKIRLQRDFFETCSEWLKWQEVSVDIKILSPGVVCSWPAAIYNYYALGLYTCIKLWKKMYKIRLQRDFFFTCNKWLKWQENSVDIKILTPGVVCPWPAAIYNYYALGLYTCIKLWKKCIKSDFKEIFFFVTNDWSDKRFLLTSKFCPLGLSAPDLQLYTIIKSWKDVYKVRGWRDSF